MLEILLIIVLTAILVFVYKKVGEWAIIKFKKKEMIYYVGFATAMLLSIFVDIIFDLIR